MARPRLRLTLLKNLSDQRVRSSATATVGHAQNLSVLEIRLIANIESRDIDRRPASGAAPSNEWCPYRKLKTADVTLRVG
jgi:hypothetical protein